MTLVLNTFKANLNPVEFTFPFMDYPSWEESTKAKIQDYPGQITCRFAVKAQPHDTGPDKARMVFLGEDPPSELPTEVFDTGVQWRIGALLIEKALEDHFQQRGFRIERTRFQVFALRPVLDSGSSALELATGISFDAKRPFRDQPYDFAETIETEQARPTLIFGTAHKLSAREPYLTLAYQFAQCVLKAQILAIVGYSFGDEHVNQIIEQGLKKNDRLRIIVVSPQAQESIRNEKFLDRYPRVFPVEASAKIAFNECLLRNQIRACLKEAAEEAPF